MECQELDESSLKGKQEDGLILRLCHMLCRTCLLYICAGSRIGDEGGEEPEGGAYIEGRLVTSVYKMK